MELENVKYDAFISYRHSPVDMYIAKSIHRRLENFKLPKSVIEKKLCEKTKINRVFRDQDELPLADNLSDPIDNALSNTDFLIVICTPRLPQSKWCIKEITTFLKTHDREHILVVLAEGEPYESFPYELTHEKITTVDADGNTVEEEREIEPLAADVRGKNKHETEKLLDDATLRLCAAIFGLNYDDLKQRHKEQQNKRRIKIAVGVAAVSVAFAAVCLFLLTKIKVQNAQILEQNEQITAQNDTISEQYDEIQEKYQSAMVSCASELFSKGRRKDALYALCNGMSEDTISSDAAYSLSNILYTYEVGKGYYPSDIYMCGNGLQDLLWSSDRRYLAVLDQKGTVKVFDVEKDTEIASITYDVYEASISLFSLCAFDTEDIYFVANDGLHRFNIFSREDEVLETSSPQIWNNEDSGVFSLDLNHLTHYTHDGSNDYTIDLDDYIEDYDGNAIRFSYMEDTAFSADGNTMAVYCELGIDGIPYVLVIDVPSGRIRTAFQTADSIMSNIATSNDTVYLAQRYSQPGYSVVYAIDINSASQVWYSIVDQDFLQALYYDDVNERVVGHNSNSFFVLDAYAGDLLYEDTISVDTLSGVSILKMIVSDGQIQMFANDGSRFSVDVGSNTVWDISSYTYIGNPPANMRMTDIVGANGALYIIGEHSNYVMKYSNTEMGELVGDFTQDEYNDNGVQKSTAIVNKEYNVVNSLQSEDGEYTFTLYVDGSVSVTDKSGKILSTIYNYEGSLIDVEKIEELGVYIIDSYSYSYLLDENMNIVAKMREFVKFEDNCFFVTTGKELYKLPYVTPKKLYKQAKDMLGDYECDEATKARYGIQ